MGVSSTLFFQVDNLSRREETVDNTRSYLNRIMPDYQFDVKSQDGLIVCSIEVIRQRQNELRMIAKRLSNDSVLGFRQFKITTPDTAAGPPAILTEENLHKLALFANTLDMPSKHGLTAIWDFINRERSNHPETPLYIGQIVKFSWQQLTEISRMAPVTLAYIENALIKEGLSLGMKIGEWMPPKQPGIGVIPAMDILMQPITSLPFKAGTLKLLHEDNITLIGDLVEKSEAELLRIPGFGRVKLTEVKAVLGTIDLRLFMQIPNWPPQG